MDIAPAPQRPLVAIRYCPKCRWLRARPGRSGAADHLPDEIDVLLSPGASGIFDITLDGAPLFSRAVEGRFPEPKEPSRRSATASPPSALSATPIDEAPGALDIEIEDAVELGAADGGRADGAATRRAASGPRSRRAGRRRRSS